MSNIDVENPDVDSNDTDEKDDAVGESVEVPLEADQADAAEQARELSLDDDEYREPGSTSYPVVESH